MALTDRGSSSEKAPSPDPFGGQIRRRFRGRAEQRRLSPPAPKPRRLKYSVRQSPPALVWTFRAPSVFLVGAPRFELGTPSPPDWCANRAALRSDDLESIISHIDVTAIQPSNAYSIGKTHTCSKPMR